MRVLFAQDIVTLIKKHSLKRFLSELITQLRHDFQHWDRFVMQPRIASHYPDGVIELMPASTADLYAFKYVNGHPGNLKKHNQLSIIGFGALAHTHTGLPFLLTEMTLLTALRTAATSALATEYLANPEPRCMALIGTGAQSEFQALALHYHCGIDTVQFYDIDPIAMNKFSHNLKNTPLTLSARASIRDTLSGAQIITTATAAKKHANILSLEDIQPGVFINGIGGDCPGKTEFSPSILNVDRVVVDFLEQARIEGEIQHASESTRITELQRIIRDLDPGRQTMQERILFDSVGCAIEDFSALQYIANLAEQYNIGHCDDYFPTVANPKNLFSILELD